MDQRLELVSPAAAPASVAATDLDSRRLLFRFVVGGTWLAGEWLGAALKALNQLPAPVDASDEVAPPGARAVIIGAVSTALRWRLPRRWAPSPPASGVVGRAAQRALRVLSHVPGARKVEQRYGEIREGAVTVLRRLAEEGVREDVAGRRLARLATPGLVELAVARVSESPELRAG